MNYIEYFKIYITICNKNIISMKITRIFQDRTNKIFLNMLHLIIIEM